MKIVYEIGTDLDQLKINSSSTLVPHMFISSEIYYGMRSYISTHLIRCDIGMVKCYFVYDNFCIVWSIGILLSASSVHPKQP